MPSPFIFVGSTLLKDRLSKQKFEQKWFQNWIIFLKKIFLIFEHVPFPSAVCGFTPRPWSVIHLWPHSPTISKFLPASLGFSIFQFLVRLFIFLNNCLFKLYYILQSFDDRQRCSKSFSDSIYTDVCDYGELCSFESITITVDSTG